jgi:ribosomal-protein-alanine N-acetyltransferase
MLAISIRPATVAELVAALGDRAALAEAIGSAVPDGWPEKEEMFCAAAARLTEHPEEAGWRVYLFFDKAETLVGSGGFLGPPYGEKPDRCVEIGYEIAPAFREHGLGAAAASALVERARESELVDTVIARTAQQLKNPSVRLLKHLGFTNTGPADGFDPGESVWQWQLDL